MALEQFKLPDLGEGVNEGELIKIHVKPGDSIKLDQVLIEVMTDKASLEVPSSLEGKVKNIRFKQGDMISVGEVVFEVETQQASKPEKQQAPSLKTETPKKESVKKPLPTPSQQTRKMAPASRKLLEELGIDVKDLPQDAELVTREDIIKHVKTRISNPQEPVQTKVSDNIEETRREPLRGIKKSMFESMSYSKKTIPHFTLVEEADVTQLVNLRAEIKKSLQQEDIKITYLPFIMRALVSVLEEMPIFNSSYDENTKELVYKKPRNFGFATDSEAGLFVPVIKQAEKKSLMELAKGIQSLSEKVRQGKASREELTGATFTLTNLGSLAGLSGTPIINPPQVAILGIYRIYSRVKQDNQAYKSFKCMNLSLTCDHRFIDGASAARFLKQLTLRIEEPGFLVLA